MSSNRGCLALRRALLSSALLLLLAVQVGNGDEVWSRKPGADRSRKQSGQITDFNGQFLELTLESGRQDRIPTVQVEQFSTAWPEQKRAADQAFQLADFATAEQQYLAALRQEQRPWAQRYLQSWRVWSLQNAGQVAAAIDAFTLLMDNDRTAHYLDAIPLAWDNQTVSGPLADKASKLLQSEKDWQRLIGASWLLSTRQRSEALQTLQTLSTSGTRQIALLAEAQKWRTEMVSANASQTKAMQDRLARLPFRLRGGPYFVVGQSLIRQQQLDAGLLMLLRVPLQFPEMAGPAAEAYWLAGDALQRSDRPDEAVRVLRELVQNYPQSALARRAAERLKPDQNNDGR